MKLPNTASLITFCIVLVPMLQAAITQVFPAADWYWSPVIVTLLGSVAKFLQTRSTPEAPPPPPEGVQFSIAPQKSPTPTWRKVILG